MTRREQPSASSAATAWSLGRREWFLAALLVVAVFLAYQPAWRGGFIWDDDAHVTKPELRSLHGLYRIWFDLGATPQYYPLTCSVFWVEHRLWGDRTPPYHLVNILLHATAALMVGLILRRMAVPGAYLAAAIFALHPVCVESVAWITELKNTLSALFYLGAAWMYLDFDEKRTAASYRWAIGLFVLALLSKTATVMLPAVLPVIFWWQRGRLSWRRDLRPLAPLFLAAAIGAMLTVWVEHEVTGAKGAKFDLTMVERCLVGGRVIWFYLGKLFWPAHLIFIYPRWQISQAVWWQYLYPAAALVLLAAFWGVRRRWRGPLAGLLFFAGMLFPVLGFFNVYYFSYSFVADHFQYLASLGIITLVSAGMALGLERLRSLPLRWTPTRSASEGGERVPRSRFGLVCGAGGYALCLALLAVLGGLTFRQCRMYANVETLYKTTIDNNPACWMAYSNLGMYLNEHRRFEEAEGYCRASLRLKTDNPQAHNNLGMALAGRGRFAEAIVHFRESVRMSPETVMPHSNLGWALGAQGRIDEAIDQFQEALKLNPNYADASHGLSMARAQKDKMLDALAGRRESLRASPHDVALLNATAWLLATDRNASMRDGEEAVELAGRAVQLSGGREAKILDTLAAAYAEAGRFSEAVATANKALDLAAQQHQQTLAEGLRSRIALYKAGKPFHQAFSALAESAAGR